MSTTSTTIDLSYCLTHQLPADRSVPGHRLCPRCQHLFYAHGGPSSLRTYHLSQPRAYGLDRAPCFVQLIDFGDFLVTHLLPPDETAERFE